jgi:predicted alpha/beta hydrolase
VSVEKILTDDGYGLATRFEIPERKTTGAVLIVPAMGVPQSFYQPLAQWLAGEGYAAATFDYRGMGASRNGSLRGLKADILDWARLDTARRIGHFGFFRPEFRDTLWRTHLLPILE